MKEAGRFADQRVTDVRCTSKSLIVELFDGRTISVPLSWYPKLSTASEGERMGWQCSTDGYQIHWPQLGIPIISDDLLLGSAAPEARADVLIDQCEEPVSNDTGHHEKMLYVTSDEAHGHYSPDLSSAVRVTSAYGSAIVVIESSNGWVKTRVFSKIVWIEECHLSDSPPAERPLPFHERDAIYSSTPYRHVEIGARGGFFTRTKSGFRRYF